MNDAISEKETEVRELRKDIIVQFIEITVALSLAALAVSLGPGYVVVLVLVACVYNSLKSNYKERLREINNPSIISGVPLSDELLSDLSFLREKIGLKSHYVSKKCLFQGDLDKESYLKHKGSNEDDFDKAVELVTKYAAEGYVFTDETGELIGHACTAPDRQAVITQGLLKNND